MVRRASALAEQLSGKKMADPLASLLDSNPELDEEAAEELHNFRRLSTLYGSNVNTVVMSKARKQSIVQKRQDARLQVAQLEQERGRSPSPTPDHAVGSGGGRGRTASTASSAGGRPRTASAIERPRLSSQQSALANDSRKLAKQGSDMSVFSNYTRGEEWRYDRPNTADATVRRLREMTANKRQNMNEPLTQRLSRPKSAITKFADRDRSKLTLRDTMHDPVHDDAQVEHPWFFGYNNNTAVPSVEPFALANRFGFRGAQALIVQTSTRARNIDVSKPHSIDVEKDLARPDEWGPTLRMAPSRGGKNLDTPGQWPEASAFPSGAPMKKPTQEYWFNRESTLGETEAMRPKSALPDRLRRTLEKEKTMLVQLNTTIKKERMELTLRPTMRPGSAPAKLRRKKKKAAESDEAVKQIINSSTLNYWGEMSANVKRELRPEFSRTALMKQNATQKLQSEMKWILLREFYKCFRRSNRGGPPHPGLQDLHELAAMFVASTTENPLPNVISRDQLLNIVSKKMLDDAFDERSAQKLFTCFDTRNTNRLPWVSIIASIRCLLQTNEGMVGKLMGVFDVFAEYARGKMTLNNCYAIFILVAGSGEELHEMKMHYRHSFTFHLRDAIRRETRTVRWR
jgi:hypothetical protein